MKRNFEYFTPWSLTHSKVLSTASCNLYAQERDWTCMIACVRTILSRGNNPITSEEEYISRYKLTPGPYYSKDVKNLKLLESYDVIYGCDISDKNFDMVLDYFEAGYSVMLESMYNYSHWMVLLGFYPIGDDIEQYNLLLYDPYYDKVRLVNADEFISMWVDGEHQKNGVEMDFIAVK